MTQNSECMRNNALFTRNEYECVGQWNIPLVKKQNINLENLNLIAFSDIKSKTSLFDITKGIHFFIDDYRFVNIYNNPQKTLDKLSRFKFVLTPDFSIYADMPKWLQLTNLAKNRWCGAYWQSKGLNVIPTISWGLAPTFDFCFDGIETNSIVAISTLGCKRVRFNFMSGYEKMIEKLNPSKIICYGAKFKEMKENIIEVPYFRNVQEVVV